MLRPTCLAQVLSLQFSDVNGQLTLEDKSFKDRCFNFLAKTWGRLPCQDYTKDEADAKAVETAKRKEDRALTRLTLLKGETRDCFYCWITGACLFSECELSPSELAKGANVRHAKALRMMRVFREGMTRLIKKYEPTDLDDEFWTCLSLKSGDKVQIELCWLKKGRHLTARIGEGYSTDEDGKEDTTKKEKTQREAINEDAIAALKKFAGKFIPVPLSADDVQKVLGEFLFRENYKGKPDEAFLDLLASLALPPVVEKKAKKGKS